MTRSNRNPDTFRSRLYQIIFESDTFGGKLFDVALLVLILLSVLTVILESVAALNQQYNLLFRTAEWIYTLLFTLEFLLRLWVSPKPRRYLFSFFGLVDLLSIVPTYLSLFAPGTQYFLVVRVLRLLRIARIFKLTHFIKEGEVLATAMRASLPKILVFIGTVLTLVIIIGSTMYVIEGGKNGFTSIPKSIYWAIVTLTTVGYGDIAPQTSLGQFMAGLVMLLGYGIIAIPTGIVTVEIANVNRTPTAAANALFCSNCGKQNHEPDAKFCNNCGSPL
jgi:voltage-gated potassium channel